MASPAKKVVKKKKEKKNIPNGVAHIQATFNNTIITITDPAGNVVAWSSAGGKGFKALVRVRRSLLRLQQRTARKRLRIMACVVSKCM